MPKKGFLFTCYGIDYFIPSARERISNKFAMQIINKIAMKEYCNAKNILALQKQAIKVELKENTYYGTDSNGMMRIGTISNARDEFIELEV